jgi:hypothetical protein
MKYIEYDSGGISVLIVCHSYKERILSRISFQGKEKHFAGNFHKWKTLEDMLSDTLVRDGFTNKINELISSHALGAHSVTITCPSNVGWESTTPLDGFRAEELETFKPSAYNYALRLIKHGREAPETNQATIIFTLTRKNGELRATIDSVYPGTNIGILKGDITKQTGRVFYAEEHPGTQPAS